MQAEQSLKEGDLQGALTQLQEQVRKQPANAGYRVFLFQLLAVAGEWGRALTQLDVAAAKRHEGVKERASLVATDTAFRF